MNKLFIQVLRCGEWRKVTTIEIERGRNPSDTDAKYSRAFAEAQRCINGWSGYFSDPLRIAEETTRGGFREARP